MCCPAFRRRRLAVSDAEAIYVLGGIFQISVELQLSMNDGTGQCCGLTGQHFLCGCVLAMKE